MNHYRTIVIADHHKKLDVARIIDRETGESRLVTLASSREELTPFLKALEGPSLVFVEACRAWEWVADLCEDLGIDLRLVNSRKMPEIAKSWKKTDVHDVEAMVDRFLTAGRLPESYAASRQERELRGLTRRLSDLRDLRRNTIYRIHAVVDSQGFAGNKTLFLKASWREEMQATLSPDVWLLLSSLLSQLDHDLSLTDRIETRVVELMKAREDARRLKAVPGIGWILAATILAETGDIRRFKSARSFAAYVGLVPRVSSSGGSVHYGHITRAGPCDLRWAIGQATMVGLRCKQQTDISRFYYRKRKKTKAKKIAITAAAHKLARALFAMLKKNEPFRAKNTRAA